MSFKVSETDFEMRGSACMPRLSTLLAEHLAFYGQSFPGPKQSHFGKFTTAGKG